MQRRERSLRDVILRLAKENLKLRYENGAEVPVSLAHTEGGGIELHAGGQPWQPWTNSSSESLSEVCAPGPKSRHDMDTAEAMLEDESDRGGRRLSQDPYECSSSPGHEVQNELRLVPVTCKELERARRGEHAARAARRRTAAAST